jgi:hypothetical protein
MLDMGQCNDAYSALVVATVGFGWGGTEAVFARTGKAASTPPVAALLCIWMKVSVAASTVQMFNNAAVGVCFGGHICSTGVQLAEVNYAA